VGERHLNANERWWKDCCGGGNNPRSS
jgi:hypothetical protein